MAKLYIKTKYGVIPDEILNDTNLSFKAKGLYGFLQSKPDGWRFSVERIAKQSKDGRAGIRAGLKELEGAGLLKRVPRKNKEGKWEGYDYILFENRTKSLGKLAEKPLAENPSTEKPSTGKRATFSNTDSSKTENSNTDKEFVLEDYLKKMEQEKRKDLKVIAVWIREKGLKPANVEQIRSIIKRNLRPAKLLEGYDLEDIKETIKILKNTDYLKKFTLETVLKYIDEIVAERQKKKQARKIVKFEQIKKDGRIYMRPIYADSK